jgi:hypothetical protein
MTFEVREKAEYVGTFRWIEVFLMETLASWVPTTPEMEIKVLFGRHVWELAQNADGLGKRAFELRAPLHYSLAPIAGFLAVLQDLRQVSSTGDRIASFYDVVLPELARRYQEYLDKTDHLLDEPSVRVIERISSGHARMLRERKEYCDLAAATSASGAIGSSEFSKRFAAVSAFVCHGSGATLSRGAEA